MTHPAITPAVDLARARGVSIISCGEMVFPYRRGGADHENGGA
jgi:hypothetical protein